MIIPDWVPRKKLAVALATVFVGVFEGRNLAAYLDPVGIPTICDGWTHGVSMGDRATPEQCDTKTLRAMNDAYDVYAGSLPRKVIDQVSPLTTAAFLSFIYNTGPGKPGVKDGFVWLKSGRHSTLFTKLSSGDVAGACAEINNGWNYSKGKKLRGLTVRRGREREVCEAGL
ncbi:Lysozyme RrrD [Carnimonas sp. R-84981]|uniref:lysozyme n=1 Tax=Carnimonas bestiolae TaxID=3402172 RepID=UPI003EDB989B